MLLALGGCGSPAASSNGNTVSLDPVSEAPIHATSRLTENAETLDYNPITGAALAEGLAPGTRPVAIMVNNLQVALPQRGISSADAIFEMVTEGGITRLMALYADARSIPQVGPVRSARDQFVQFAMPLNAVYVHIGTSIYAENLLNEYTYDTINGMYLGTTSFWFDTARNNTGLGNEHCWYTDAGLIAAGIEKRQIATTGKSQGLFKFAEALSPMPLRGGSATDIQFNFSPGAPIQLTYEPSANMYLKKAYGAPQTDELNGAQLSFSNVLLLFTDVTLKPDGQCTDFYLGGGTGYYCYGGRFQKIIWKKGLPEQPLRIYDADGKEEVLINVGKSYIAVIGKENASGLLLNAGQADMSTPEA